MPPFLDCPRCPLRARKTRPRRLPPGRRRSQRRAHRLPCRSLPLRIFTPLGRVQLLCALSLLHVKKNVCACSRVLSSKTPRTGACFFHLRVAVLRKPVKGRGSLPAADSGEIRARRLYPPVPLRAKLPFAVAGCFIVSWASRPCACVCVFVCTYDLNFFARRAWREKRIAKAVRLFASLIETRYNCPEFCSCETAVVAPG